jgi:Ca2+-binding RTX toxin-like protein
MAVVVGGNGGFSMIDPLAFGKMLESFAIGTSTATSWTTQTSDSQNTWVFSGFDFGAFQSGIPTAGAITGFTYTTPQGGTLATFSGLSLTMTVFFTYLASNNFQGLIQDMLSGDDSITGGTGDDVLFGYNGNDTILGGDGNDRIDGGTGTDTLDGQAGVDTLGINRSSATNSVTVNTTGMSGATFTEVTAGLNVRNFEQVNMVTGSGNDIITIGHVVSGLSEWRASAGSDLLVWDMSASVTTNISMVFSASDRGRFVSSGLEVNFFDFERFNIVGGSGNDTLNGLAGDDILEGGAGNDTLNGSSGSDILRGGAGDDTLIAGSGGSGGPSSSNDLLEGGDGNDTLRGVEGTNTMLGGAGDDVIVSGGHLC